eukprot:03860_4
MTQRCRESTRQLSRTLWREDEETRGHSRGCRHAMIFQYLLVHSAAARDDRPMSMRPSMSLGHDRVPPALCIHVLACSERSLEEARGGYKLASSACSVEEPRGAGS